MFSLRHLFRSFGTPKSCIQPRNTSFASFYVLKVCEMLPTTAKHHFGSNGEEWMFSLRNYFHNFVTLKLCIMARNTSFESFYVPKVYEMLPTTAKHHFGSKEVEYMLSLRNLFRNFGTPKSCIRPRNTSFASFSCRRFAKCSQPLQNIILGLNK